MTLDFLTEWKFHHKEKTLKRVSFESHWKFNDSCLINDLLPTYTNAYIYMFTRDFSSFDIMLLDLELQTYIVLPEILMIKRLRRAI